MGIGSERHGTTTPTSSSRYGVAEAGFDSGRASSPDEVSPASSCLDSPSREGSLNGHNGIPTIEISDPRDNRSPSPHNEEYSMNPRLGSKTRTQNVHQFKEGSVISKLAYLKKKTYHVLSLGHDTDDPTGEKHEDGLLKAPNDSSLSLGTKRRATSMPEPNSQQRPQMDIFHHADPLAARRFLTSGSPPIVDFTKFEDRYRSSSDNYDGLLAVSKGYKMDDGRISPFYLGENRGRSRFYEAVDEKDKVPGATLMHASKWKNMGRGIEGIEMVHDRFGSKRAVRPASERKPDPRLVVDALENILGDAVGVRKFLDLEELMKFHEIDREDFERRERERRKVERTGGDKPRTVLGEPIQTASIYASTTMTLGEREHELPIVVVHCVEELYRTGIYQSNLFRMLPNRPRLLELISIFDAEEQPPGSVIRSRTSSSASSSSVGKGFGAATSLHLESTPDICALLTSYLSALPEPVLSTYLFEPIWELCGVEKLSQSERRQAPATPSDTAALVRLSSVPLARSYTPQSEASCILAAQLLLHLLPSSHFSLLVYLLSFFSQVALVREENGVGVEDLSRMFGARIFGQTDLSTSMSPMATVRRSSSRSAKGKEKEKNGRGEVMMMWFLRRWGPLSETLFEVVDDVRLGVFHRNKRMRKDSFGKDARTSAYAAARDALSAHEAVQSEIQDDREETEMDEEVEEQIERELMDDGDMNQSVDLPEPVSVVRSPPTVHVPLATSMDYNRALSSMTLERQGTDFLPPPSIANHSSQRSSISSGSSSSTLPPYTAEPSSFKHAPDPAGGGSDVRRFPNEFETTISTQRTGDGDFPEDTLYHSTPRKIQSNRVSMELSTGSIPERNAGPLNNLIPRSPVDHGYTARTELEGKPLQQDNTGSLHAPLSTYEPLSLADRHTATYSSDGQFSMDGESLPSSHERLLDISMPTTMFELDETMPLHDKTDDGTSSFSSSLLVTPRPGQPYFRQQTDGLAATPRSNATFTPTMPSGLGVVSPLRLGSESRSSLSSTMPTRSPLSIPPPRPARSPERKTTRPSRTHSKLQLPMSRSFGSQNLPQLPNVATPTVMKDAGHTKDGGDKDAIIDALRGRLVELEKERDEARRVVMEVRKALRIL